MPDVVEEVAPEIYRVEVPVPFRALRTVNAYLLRHPDGWDLVDTGMKTPEALATWEIATERLGVTPDTLRKIVLTHHHPDHVGLAGWFQEAARAAGGPPVPVWCSAREIEILDLVWGRRGARDGVLETFFGQCGVPDPEAATFSEQEVETMRRLLTPFPDAFQALEPGTSFVLGTRTVTAIHTPGHSDGHLAFYDPADRLLLVGDHVLPRITPNVGRWPGTEPDPLGRYLGSLRHLAALPVERALPGHGGVVHDWAGRITELIEHHAERLRDILHLAEAGATVVEVAVQAFAYAGLDRHEARMALVETLAHLEHLVARGDLVRRDAPVWRFRRA